jgi:O-antigen/teichoic acid export membrane protein
VGSVISTDLETTSTSTRIARNAGVVLVARGFNIVVRLITISLFASYLGKAGFGVYSYVVAFGEIFGVLSDFGVIRVGVREIARDRESAAEQFGNVLALKGLLSLLTVAIVVGLAWATDMDAGVRSAIAIYTGAVVLNYYANAFFVFYRAFERMEYEAVLIILERALYLIFAFVAVQWKLGLQGIFVGTLLSSAIKLMIAPILTHVKVIKLKLQLTAASFLAYFRESLPIGISMFISSVYLRVDVLILEYLRNSAEVGAFSGAYRIVDATMVLPVVIVTALFPVMSRKTVAGTEILQQFLSKSFKVLLVMALPISVPLFVWAEPLVAWILDRTFVESVYSLRLLSIVLVLSYPNFLFNYAMTSLGKQKVHTIVVALSLGLDVVGSFVMVPSLGYIGACLSTILAELFVFSLALFLLRRYADYRLPLAHIWKPLFAGALMAGVAYVGRDWSNFLGLVLLFALAAAVYAGALVLTGGVSLDEILTVKSILSDLGRQGFRPAPGRRPGT